MPEVPPLPGKGEIVHTPEPSEEAEWLPLSTRPAPTTTLLGLKGSGKTYLIKNGIIPAFSPYYFVIDPDDEYQGFNRYVPSFTDDHELYKLEIELLIRTTIIPSCDTLEEQKARGKRKARALRLLIIEEADLLAPVHKNINPMLRRLVVLSRHLDLALLFVARRPTDLNTYLMDTSDFLICFKQAGANALRVLKDISEGAKGAIKTLDYENHEFLFFDRNRDFEKMTMDDLIQTLSEECGLTPA